MKTETDLRFHVAQLTDIDPVRCPCGWARRAYADIPDSPASVHVVDIEVDSQRHYHKEHTEIYVVLEGEGHLEVDSERIPISPLLSVLLKPGCRHRAVGKMRILNICIPAFDPQDEWFD